MLDVNKFRLNSASREASRMTRIEKISVKDIAIIGMACEFGNTQHMEEFWQYLREGRDLVRPFPHTRRKDTDGYLRAKGYAELEKQYSEGGYLEEIDKFDPLFFKIPPKEANLMDPHQRIFLQTAWHALEDAGYGGKKLSGSNTGVYVGFSSDFGREYKDLVQELERESQSLSLGGNIKSIIASRISYILNWNGPSVMVDTACSSSLVAIHMACRALRGGECDQALAGSVKVKLLPLKGQEGIGIRSSIDRARTFDDTSDGTGSGEGCAVILLKPLHRAIEDGDRILAVIKGSAVNQDGTSNGITAPNPLAQADVIQRAWKDAEINPETISYIEAHGTGTRLGDPIEIDGITRAFYPYTNRKQFCGIGAAKTNTGHLDHAAGMVGIVKAVLALQHSELPPLVHFQRPNQEINFHDSPVYVVERLTPWVSDGTPRRCGVSAFGLSGTNCHIILEEAPEVPKREAVRQGGEGYLLTISAPKEKALRRLIKAYDHFLQEVNLDLTGLCYTANTGRGHYTCRLLLHVHHLDELRDAIRQLCHTNDLKNLTIPGVYYREHRLNDAERQQLTDEAGTLLQKLHAASTERGEMFGTLIELYMAGAEVEWEAFYQGQKPAKVALPTYPFEEKRCWVEGSWQTAAPVSATQSPIHPLIDRLYEETAQEKVYMTEFNAHRQWELQDHLVSGYHVLPGTSYLEMAREVSKAIHPNAVEIRDMVFLTPLAMLENEAREAHTILRAAEGYHEFNVVSKEAQGDGWTTHVDAKIFPLPSPEIRQYKLDDLKARCPRVIAPINSDGSTKRAIVVGPHWKNVNTYHLGDDELLVHLTLQNQFLHELDHYTIYPSLLDSAVNAASQHIGEGLYLPFSYRSFKLLRKMPANIYSYIRKRADQAVGLETVAFDITLMDETGQALIEIEDYKIKKVRTQELKVSRQELYHENCWIAKEGSVINQVATPGTTLLFTDEYGIAPKLADELRSTGNSVITVTFGNAFAETSSDHFTITGNAADYQALCEVLAQRSINRVIHMGAMGDVDLLHQQLHRGVHSLFHLSRAIVSAHWKGQIDLILIADHVHAVNGEEPFIHPHHAAFFGLAKVLPSEFTHLRVRTIDIDLETSTDQLIAELHSAEPILQVAYRRGERYIEEFRIVELEHLPEVECELKEEGVYIITGGTGALGLAVSQYLAAQKPLHLALINRTSIPPQSEWDAIRASTTNDPLRRKILALQALEDTGAQVNCYAVDLTDRDGMMQTVQELRTRYGRINGVIHCAGVAGDGFILRKEEATFQTVLGPKVYGTWLLDQFTREDRPDFFILFSSVNAHYGRPGQGDYTAANAYLDSFAAYRQRQGLRTLSINWAAWKEIGMAAEHGVNEERAIFKALPTETALRALDELFYKDVTQITVGELNYDLLSGFDDNLPFILSSGIRTQISRRKKLAQKPQEHSQEQKPTVQVVVKGSDESSDLELRVAQIWADVLGLEEVDVYESFYDLGGDSILATYILKEMDKQFPGMIDISDVFTYSSVHAMADFLQSKVNPEPRMKKDTPEDLDVILDSMLDQLLLSELNSEEAEKILMSKLGGSS